MDKEKMKLVYESTSFGVWLMLPVILAMIFLLTKAPNGVVFKIVVILMIMVYSFLFYKQLKEKILLMQFKGGRIYVNYMFGKKSEFVISESVSCMQKKVNIITNYGSIKGDSYTVKLGRGDIQKTLSIPDFDTNNKSSSVSASIRIGSNAKELISLIKDNVKKNNTTEFNEYILDEST